MHGYCVPKFAKQAQDLIDLMQKMNIKYLMNEFYI